MNEKIKKRYNLPRFKLKLIIKKYTIITKKKRKKIRNDS